MTQDNDKGTMLLINPPVVRPCEAPAGIARLLGTLKSHGVSCRVLDANLEGLLHLLDHPGEPKDTWSKRAVRNRASNLSALRGINLYQGKDRYSRSVREINRVLGEAGYSRGVRIGLANYEDPSRSPLRSADLIEAAEQPEKNPFYPYFMERLTALFEDGAPSLVGISLNYLSQALPAFSLIGLARKLCLKARYVLGGGLVTSWLSNPEWANPFGGLVDDMIAGPGEGPLLAMAGITPPGSHAAPDYTPFHTLPYLSPGLVLPYSTSNGCWWGRCTFCPEKAEGNAYSALPAPMILSEIDRLAVSERPCLIHFLDNAMSPALLAALADHPPGIPWYGFARITRHLTDPSFCRELKRAGCVMLKIGLESGDQGVLDSLDKGIDLGEATSALRTLKEAGIGTYVYLLFGTPAEREREAKRTLEYVIQNHECIDYMNIALFNMPAYGPDTAGLDTQEFYHGDLTLYRQFRHPEGWDRGRVRRFLDGEFRKNPAVREIILRDPPVFTSNHAPFFLMADRGKTGMERKSW